MLTAAQSIVDYRDGRAVPDRLTRARHSEYPDLAARMLAAYRAGVGRTRDELHRAVRNVLAGVDDCPDRRAAAFCKLLDDAGEFDADRRGDAAALRLRVFALATPYHPLVTTPDRVFETAGNDVKARIARELDCSWEQVEQGLYRDLIQCQRLRRFDGFVAKDQSATAARSEPEALLSCYNVAQLQACLYRAESMTVDAGADFKTILRYAKLARLMHEISLVDAGSDCPTPRYRIHLSGPASVLHLTRRYGVSLARFLPALLACRDWTMRATIRTPRGRAAELSISSGDGLTSHLPAPELFDSSVEESFARRFGPNDRDGWRLHREAGVLHDGQATFIPDFLLRHRDGREVFLEIVGFWTPKYLDAKRRTLERFRSRGRPVLVAVAQRLCRPRPDAAAMKGVIVYKSALKVDAVLAALDARDTPSNGRGC